jgi:polar amino acid transport system substrate-binding protein
VLDRSGTFRWEAPVHGAWVNTMVAVSSLRSALDDNDLDSFQADMTQALSGLQVALGRASEVGTLGGLEGALANTGLGVPAGAHRVSGCQSPDGAPAYGVTDGFLAFFAVSVNKNGKVVLPQSFGESRLTVKDGFVVVHTSAANKVAGLCKNTADNTGQAATPPSTLARADAQFSPDPAQSASAHAETGAVLTSASTPGAKQNTEPGTSKTTPGASSSLPALYTENQAKAGKQIYAKSCARCHGADTQGGAAPANAGTAFLKKAHALSWSVSDVRYLVVNSMPLDNPGSLSPKEYAQVMAFLLASSCYPAGGKAFPVDDAPRLKNAKLAPSDNNMRADKPKSGVCTVP